MDYFDHTYFDGSYFDTEAFGQTVEPGTATLTLTTYAPIVSISGTTEAARRWGVAFPDFIPIREITVTPRPARLQLTALAPVVVVNDRIPRDETALALLGIV